LGFHFLRFLDIDAKKNMEGVLSTIREWIERYEQHTPTSPLNRGVSGSFADGRDVSPSPKGMLATAKRIKRNRARNVCCLVSLGDNYGLCRWAGASGDTIKNGVSYTITPFFNGCTALNILRFNCFPAIGSSPLGSPIEARTDTIAHCHYALCGRVATF
jgi:hypothetical protein